jgi:hydroxymethylglutaryl-CoA synthase
MESMETTAEDYQFAVFHQPNTKFPQRVARSLGFSNGQIEAGLLVPRIGNVYAGSALVGLTAVLDIAKPGDHILLVSYGSGAGSDAISLRVTDQLINRREAAPSTERYIARRTEIDYATYARYRGKLALQ